VAGGGGGREGGPLDEVFFFKIKYRKFISEFDLKLDKETITTLGELSFVEVGTDVVVVAGVVAGLARSSKDSWTARGATGEDSSPLLFSFSSSTMMTAPGTLSVILDEACMAAFSVCGVRVTDDLTIVPSKQTQEI
jgi:hypothetical protein